MKNPPPLRRPSTARPRDAATPEPDAPIEASGSDPTGPDGPAPPIPDELLAIERGLTTFAELAGARIEPAPELGVRLVTWPGRGLAFNHAVEPRWDADWRERADALAQRLGATGNLPSLATFEATASPPDLADRLIGAGWVEIGREQILWTRRAGGVPHLDPRMRIENVVPDRAAEYEAVEREIFGLLPSDAADRLTALRTAIEERRLRAYLVRVGDEPVATCRLVSAGPVAGIQGVGVVEGRRRQGYGGLVTTVATRTALITGHHLVWLAVEEGNAGAARLYARLDYRPAGLWRRLVKTA